MKDREELIDDFLRDVDIFDFKFSPIFTMDEEEVLSIKVFTEDEKPILNIDFESTEPVLIYPLGITSTHELVQYSWIFSRVAELMNDLKEATK